LNAGSSSLKAAGFTVGESNDPVRVVSATAERISPEQLAGYADALDDVVRDCERAGFAPDAIAHRFVHGGPNLVDHVLISRTVREKLANAAKFAPVHLPAALSVLDEATARYPQRTHVACLDTAFHRHLLPAARRLPLPAAYDAIGVRRYGFHGLSYEYLVHHLGASLGQRAVLAHLGNGASLAAVRDGIGIDTTMGLTPTGGLVMGTRTGDLDPGVLIYLMRNLQLDSDQLEHLIDHQSGLHALSGGSADVRELLIARAHGDERAVIALDMFETAAAKHIAALVTVLGGLDTLVFTGGIGEHAAPVRTGIASRLHHLGVVLNTTANHANAAVISTPDSAVSIRVEPTNEELIMALHATRLVPSAM
jgi:acetate kinase